MNREFSRPPNDFDSDFDSDLILTEQGSWFWVWISGLDFDRWKEGGFDFSLWVFCFGRRKVDLVLTWWILGERVLECWLFSFHQEKTLLIPPPTIAFPEKRY
jgi:hypothetical protein